MLISVKAASPKYLRGRHVSVLPFVSRTIDLDYDFNVLLIRSGVC